MRINLRQIDAFRAAMELGSATAASEALHITQPAVSRLIRDLEAEVGFQLFERRARGLVPTRDANVLYEEVKRSFIGMDRIGQVASAIKEKSTGTVRVISLSKYADGIVARMTGTFLKNNPGVVVELESARTAAVVEGIASQAFDVGIAAATVSHKAITAEPLFETSVVLAMAATDPLANRDRVPIHELDGRRMFALPEDSQYGSVIGRAFRAANIKPEIIGQARTHESLCRMVASGTGIALVDRIIADDYRAGDVTFIALDPPVTRMVATLVNARLAPSIAAASFIEHLRAESGQFGSG
jgi:DNA-binding transcriptional LysR family regulator